MRFFPIKIAKINDLECHDSFQVQRISDCEKSAFELDTACLKRSNGFAIDLLNHTSLIYLFEMKWMLDTAGKNCR